MAEYTFDMAPRAALLTGSLGLLAVASDRLGSGETVGAVVVLQALLVTVQEEVRGTGR